MTTVVLILVAWAVLSLPIGMVVGALLHRRMASEPAVVELPEDWAGMR